MDLCFRQATPEDIPAMQTLWEQSFPEDESRFIAEFFAKAPISCGFIACKGEVLSMLFLLPAQVEFGSCCWSARYLYAGCTQPSHRGQGIYTRLMQFAAMQAATQRISAIYLHPASQDLVAYYRKLGYRDGIGSYIAPARDGQLPVVSVSEYLARRRTLLCSSTPRWVLEDDWEAFFLADMQCHGWTPTANATGCTVVSPQQDIFYDTLPGRAEVWQNTALWLPIGEDISLVGVMNNAKAYTAFLGDI